MIRAPPGFTLTDTLLPYPTRVRPGLDQQRRDPPVVKETAPKYALRDIMDRDARRGPQRDRAADRRAAEPIVPQAQRQADPQRPHFSAQKLPAQEKEQTERGQRRQIGRAHV